MFPVRATVVPKVEEWSEFLTINASRIVDMETHNHRRNREPKNPISKLKHLKARREPTVGGLEEMTNRIWVQLEDASAKRNHQPGPKTGASRTNRRSQIKPEGILEGQPWPKVQEREVHAWRNEKTRGRGARGARGPELEGRREEGEGEEAITATAIALSVITVWLGSPKNSQEKTLSSSWLVYSIFFSYISIFPVVH
jgi:hypothetical protein